MLKAHKLRRGYGSIYLLWDHRATVHCDHPSMGKMRRLLILMQALSSSSFLTKDLSKHRYTTISRCCRCRCRQRLASTNNNNNNLEESVSRRSFFYSAAFGGLAFLEPVQAAPLKSDDILQQQQQAPRSNKRIGGLVNKIRGIGTVMDELQRDLMQERWDLVDGYPAQLRSFVPVLTTYTDSAFPTDAPTDKGLRIALRYEVGRFFASVERLRQAASRTALDEAYVAYSEMSLHFDRYLRVGGLYTYYDDTIDNEPYFTGISDAALVYDNPKVNPPLVRDLIVLIKGPDKGKTGIVIGKYLDGSGKMIIKLDRFKGMREIRLVSDAWVAKRLGEQDPDDVFIIPRKGV